MQSKLQLGEVMPSALQLMAKSAKEAGLDVDGTVKSMLALQQKGGLISSKVLPLFAKNLSLAAKNNNALNKALDSNRVAMNQMVTGFQMGADTIFKSGWSEGLTELFKSTSDMLKENEHSFKAFGSVMGKVFKGIAWLIKNVLSPVFSAFGSVLNVFNDLLEASGNWAALLLVPLIKLSPVVRLLTFAMSALGIATNVAFLPMIAMAIGLAAAFFLVVGALEEISEFFSPTGKKTYIGFSIEDIKPPAWLTEFMTWVRDDQNASVKTVTKENYSMYGIKTTTTPVKMYSDIYIGREQVGKAVASSEAIQKQTASQIAESNSHNY